MSQEIAWLCRTQKAASFRDSVIANHFNESVASSHTVGIEVEYGGLSPEQTLDLVLAKLGGRYTGQKYCEDTCKDAYFVEDTAIGAIRIERETFIESVERGQRRNNLSPLASRLLSWTANRVDSAMAATELVTEPLNWQQVQVFATFMNDLAAAGALGSSTAHGRLVSTQVNVGIDWRDAGLLKTLLGNYYRNQAPIRADTRPALGRRPYIERPDEAFIQKLSDPSWQPDIHELFVYYQTYSHPKRSSLQAFCALLMDELNHSRDETPMIDKVRKPRPAIEFREPNTHFVNDGTTSELYLLREVKFALAMVAAAERGEQMRWSNEVAHAQQNRLGTAPT